MVFELSQGIQSHTAGREGYMMVLNQYWLHVPASTMIVTWCHLMSITDIVEEAQSSTTAVELAYS